MLPEVSDFTKWLRRKSPQATTPIHYGNDLKLFFEWADKPPDQVTLVDVDRYIEASQSQGQARATINRRLAALRSFYRYLTLMSDEAPTNPVIPKRHYIRQGRRLPRDVTDEVLQRFFAVIGSERDKAIFLLMLRCGLRIEEVHTLCLSDLYLQPSGSSLPRLWVKGKNEGQRVVYLSEQALSGLQKWLAVRPTVASQALFLNRSRKRLSISGIQKRLACYRHQAGVQITSHQFRHTLGRHLVEARVPVTTIQKLLGHARLQTTELYLHISDSQVQADYQAAMQALVQRLEPKGGE